MPVETAAPKRATPTQAGPSKGAGAASGPALQADKAEAVAENPPVGASNASVTTPGPAATPGVAATPGLAGPAGPAGPLAPEHHEAIALADRRRRRIDRAAGVATFNGWTTAVFAALSVPFAFFSVTALVMGLALAAVAYQEFKGRRLLRQLDPKAPRLLGFNQLAFTAVLVLYSLWNIYKALTGPNPYAEHMANVEMATVLGPIDQMHKTITLAVYGTIIVLSVIFQGSTALYYFTRLAHLRAYLSETPDWILQLQRSMAGSGRKDRTAHQPEA